MVPRLAVVIPCYNEEEALPVSLPVFLNVLDGLKKAGEIRQDSCLLLVDDGSTDRTWKYIVDIHLQHTEIRGIRLSRNFGQQNALYAGIMKAREKCDIAVTIDADLQDDIGVLPEMMRRYRMGNEIVYGVRKERKGDSLIKRSTAEWYYRVMKLFEPDTIPGHADFRLMSRRVMDLLCEYRGQELYLRGILPNMGFRSSVVFYDRRKRAAGSTGYSPGKMVHLAASGLMRSGGMKKLSLLAPAAAFAVLLMDSVFRLIEGDPKKMPGSGDILLHAVFLEQAFLISIGNVILKEVQNEPRYIVSDATD